MKKLMAFAALIITFSALLTAPALAQELKLSGDAKTGIYWVQEQQKGKEPTELTNPLRMESHDGDPNGNRFRLNLDFDSGKNFGFRGRLDWTNWSNDPSNPFTAQPKWKYAFGYVNFFENQMTVSIGKLGGSPWGTGGPEKWKELEQNNQGGGMRVEWKPAFIPEQYGKLNAGFVLNWADKYTDSGASRDATMIDLLRESVIGASYTHPFFMARFAYRLDSTLDIRDRGSQALVEKHNGNEGGDFIYRLEEYALKNLLPGLQMWALGVYEGIFAPDSEFYMFENWVFAEYNPPELFGLTTPFTAQIRFGYDYMDLRSQFHIKPSFYWHFFNKLLSAGASFSYRQDYGNKVYDGSPYMVIQVEPKIQLNFTSSYIAFVYNWQSEYMGILWPELDGRDPTKETQYINLRFCIYY